MGIGKMFSDPAMFAKLASNPRTAKHLADVSFMQKVCVYCVLRRSPRSLQSLLPASTHTAEPATGTGHARQRSAHD
jgi:hypothetical protein